LADPATPEKVGVLLETVRSLLAEENEREQSLNTRGVGFAGFVAIVLPLTTTLGYTALSSDWGTPWKGIAVGLYALALLALLASVILVVHAVLRPQTASSLALGEVQRYPTTEYLEQSRLEIEGAIMRGLIDTLGTARKLGQRKARGLRHGCELLLIGLSCIATLGFLLGLHDARLIDSGTTAVKGAGQGAGRPPAAGYPGRRAQAPSSLEPKSPRADHE
jgi:hypothetical protein